VTTERSLRVALLCPYSLSVVGGVQIQVLGLARALRERGVDARVIAPSDGPPPAPGITSLGPARRFPANGSIAPIAVGKAVSERTLEALRSFAPDVLHLHEPLMPGANHAALVGTDVPAVGTFHAAHSGRNGWYDAFRLPLRLMIERLAVRTAVSEEAQRNVEAFGVRCEIMANGVDVDAFASVTPTPAPASASGLGQSIVFVGRHEPRKGLGVLLDAFGRLDRPDVRLWVLGDGPQTTVLKGKGVANVDWLGTVSETEKLARLAGATVACFPSIGGESFGVVLLEATAAGVPIVASDLIGYRNVVRDGLEALLVPPGDPGALAEALGRAIDSPALRERLRSAGRRRAVEFSLTRLADSFVDRYEMALRTTRPAVRSRRRRAAALGAGVL
jgi:phosphatidylinositol alpha-mannosyltransferase